MDPLLWSIIADLVSENSNIGHLSPGGRWLNTKKDQSLPQNALIKTRNIRTVNHDTPTGLIVRFISRWTLHAMPDSLSSRAAPRSRRLSIR